MSPEKPNAGKPVQRSEGLIYYAVSEYNLGTKSGSPNREKISAVAPLYSEADIPVETPDKHSGNSNLPHETPAPASLWPSVSPSSLWLGPRQPLEALCQSFCPLRHPCWPSKALRSSWLALHEPWLALREPLAASASLSGYCANSPGVISASLLLYSLPLNCNSDHSLKFLGKPSPRKSKF